MNLDAAIRAVRAESLDRSTGARVTRDRVLESVARSPRRRLHAVVAAVIASMFGASAFAWYVRTPAPPPPRAAVLAPVDTPAAAIEPVAPRVRTTKAVELPVIEPVVEEPRIEPAPRIESKPRLGEAAPATPAPDAELALYATAHELHFRARDLSAAVDAWTRYIDAAPSGKLAPEARFNRLVALVRLQRWAEAKQALATIDADFRPRDVERLRAIVDKR
jgi:hypothetical protein